jgi:3-phosphoshikimate 1-carboxyvinyltransferase
MAPLLRGLEALGCSFTCEENEDCFPFTLHGHGFQADGVTVDIDRSSQFLSALLISSCLSPRDFTTTVTGSHGMAYVEMTVKMMQQFGVMTRRLKSGNKDHSPKENNTIINDDPKASCQYFTPAGQQYKALDYQIEPDVSGAAYFYAMCPLLNLPVQVSHVHFDSLQGDVAFLHALERLGCHAEDLPEGILLTPPKEGSYPGITVDMSACSDQAITMAALAPFAKSPTTITGIGHIRFQESDRLSAMQTELTKLGIRCETTDSSITIWPGDLKPGLVKTYDDHRMAMGFTLLGLRSPGIVIDDPGCCRKTFENYYEVLEKALCISSRMC